MTKLWLRDALERVVATYVEAFAGLLIAAGTGLVTLSSVKAAAVAAIPAAVAVVKTLAAARVSGTVSAASVAPDPHAYPAVMPEL